ncbi:MAG: hypothetical protein Q8J89_11525 [Caulobacter sp.]|nr:hypothetical protein [Caulobacter sp.]
MRIFAGVCLAAFTLAACDRPAEAPKAPDGKPASAQDAAPVPAGVDAAPAVKGGLWELTSRTPGMEGKVRTCFDPAIQGQSAVVAQGMDRRNCSRSDWRKTADGHAFDIACERGGRLFVSSGTLTGDLTQTYVMKADSVMSLDGVTRGAKQDVSGRYMGDCPADMKAGDVLVQVEGRWQRPALGAAG